MVLSRRVVFVSRVIVEQGFCRFCRAGFLSYMYAACTICMKAGDYVRGLTHLPLSTVIN